MTEDELRALVREAIARHSAMGGAPLDPGEGAAAGAPRVPSGSAQAHLPRVFATATRTPRHASHAMFVLPAGAEMDGPCLIEPAVACNHCGYCRSYGH